MSCAARAIGGSIFGFKSCAAINRATRFSGHFKLQASRTAASRAMDEEFEEADFYKHGLKHHGGTTMDNTLDRVGNVRMGPLPRDSAFIRPGSVYYQLDDKQRRWDVVASHASVGIVVWHTQLRALLLVRQFRPAVYAAAMRQADADGQLVPPLTAGFTYELCAGIIDKAKSLQQIAAEEVEEECGYRVPEASLRKLCVYVGSTGISGSPHHMFYTEVDESMRSGPGGGVEGSGERIEVLMLPGDQIDAFIADESCKKSAGLLFALAWLQLQQQQGQQQQHQQRPQQPATPAAVPA